MFQKGKLRTILITGASSGIGKATALYLAAKGYHVIGTSRSSRRLAALQTEARERALPLAVIELDINQPQAIEQAIPRLIREHGTIDVLVNNAGYGLWGPVETISITQLKNQFETNLFAPVRLIKAVLPGMKKQGEGLIINISSVLGRLATPFNGGYASSKFALEGISESLRSEMTPFGIHTVILEPGLFRTSFIDNQVVGETTYCPGMLYEPFIANYQRMSLRLRGNAGDPEKVGRVILRIIRSKHPAFRYTIGMDARLGVIAAKLLPEHLFLYLLRKTTMG